MWSFEDMGLRNLCKQWQKQMNCWNFWPGERHPLSHLPSEPLWKSELVSTLFDFTRRHIAPQCCSKLRPKINKKQSVLMWHYAKIHLFHDILNIELRFTEIPVRCCLLKQEDLIGRAFRETEKKKKEPRAFSCMCTSLI